MDDKTIKLTERKDLSTECPHCHRELNEIYYTYKKVPPARLFGFIPYACSPVRCFICPYCRKLIGVESYPWNDATFH